MAKIDPTNSVKWPITDEEIAEGAERAMSENSLQKWRTRYAELLEEAKRTRAMQTPSVGRKN